MFKLKNLFILVIIFGLTLPIIFAQAGYNTITWGPGDRLYFSGVAVESGGQKGVSIDINSNTYVHSYILDVDSLRVTMYPGSEIHFKSLDRKIFTTNIETAETVCSDGYSIWDYSTPNDTVTFTISLADDSNCPAAASEEDSSGESEQINIEDLDSITEAGIDVVLEQNSTTHFVLGTVIETITVESIGSTKVTISLSTPANKNLYLQKNKIKNIDTDADGYRDLRVTLESTAGGRANLRLEKIKVVKINNAAPCDLLKVAGSLAVYYYGADSQRYVFPNEKVFYSWYDNFDNVIIISSEDMAKLPIGGLVTYRPGVKLVTFTSTNDVYAVAQDGELRKLKGEQMAKDLYGENWNKLVDDINDAFYTSYSFGEDLIEATDYIKEDQKTLSPDIGVDKEI